jgi:transcriptional regulator with XRE-family HTH domain
MANELLNTSGKRLRAVRVNAGLSQKEIAERLGITQSYLSRIENGGNPINSVVVQLAEILGVSTDYLLMRTDELHGAAGDGGAPAEDAREETNMRLLRLAISDVPDVERSDLLRYLIRQVAVYRDTFVRK